ncbi:uncharacterized protein K02A2.6-like [Wyeomyia smithii]|uniref:uncharacterized protein K02A2.6-like n=1 Tax=Wyeomyia smithii TaxID=174621 RepID=UPI002467DE2A|nr:uncharacterized protein K02A2.6-like [Wyeomyia smithii]
MREPHPLPLVDELLGSVDGATVFSKIDVKDAYHQLEISQQSRPITTFIMKTGLYRYKRLMFGVSCAPEIFQKTMETVLVGLKGIIIYLDDIVVFGASKIEHDKRLEELLKRLEQYGVLLNHQKCVYRANEIEFLGHVLNANGVKPTESRITAIRSFREPKIAYNYETIYESGSNNLADALSRLCVIPPKAFDHSTEMHIHRMVQSCVLDAVVLKDIVEATKKDGTLQEVLLSLEMNTWTENTRGYKQFKPELHTAGGVVMRGDRRVIPETLQAQVIACAHEGHPGMSSIRGGGDNKANPCGTCSTGVIRNILSVRFP